LPEERQWMDWLFSETEPEVEGELRANPLGFVDAYRLVNQEEHHYTWCKHGRITQDGELTIKWRLQVYAIR